MSLLLVSLLLVAALVGAWLVLRNRTAAPPAAVPATRPARVAYDVKKQQVIHRTAYKE